MSTLLRPAKPRHRADFPTTGNLCEHCVGKCCRYFALPIDTPDEINEFENIRWYMLHGRVSMFVDEGTWYLMVHTPCDKLQPDYRCGIYETRPLICRAYSTDNCEFEDDAVYDQFFETPEQIREYMESVFPELDVLPNASTLPVV